MKQKGKFWIDSEGNQIPATRVSSLEKITEQFGQQIASEALVISRRLETNKSLFISKCQEIARRMAAQNGGKSSNQITFYTFDKEFRIEYKQKEQQVVVFQATKEKPSYKDYRVVVMDFFDTPVLYHDSPTEEASPEPVRMPKGHTVPGVLQPGEGLDPYETSKELLDYSKVPVVSEEGKDRGLLSRSRNTSESLDYEHNPTSEHINNVVKTLSAESPSTEEVSAELLKQKPEPVQKKFEGSVKSSSTLFDNGPSPFEKAIRNSVSEPTGPSEEVPDSVPADLPGPSED